MFKLENAIQTWKRRLRSNPAFEDGDVTELESHLRDEIDRLKAEGLSEEEAFDRAAAEIGEPEPIGDELYKSRATQMADPIPPWKQNAWYPSLLPNYIKVTLRNIKRNPVYSIINILGLSTGIAVSTLIFIYLQFQLSFDDFHTKADQIYRLNKVVTPKTGGTELHAITSGPMGPQLKRDYPEVDGVVRVLPWFDDGLISFGEEHLKIGQFVLVDSTFFRYFDFELLRGDPATALKKPLSIVLSEKIADRLFGDADPIGKTVNGLNDLEYTVTGVVENTPENSHITYDALISWSSSAPSALDFGWLENWFPQALYTYLILEEDVDADLLEGKLTGFMSQHFSERADQYQLYLQPMQEIYLHSTKMRFTDRIRTGDIKNVYIFSASALLILIIACINFVNLTTAKSMERAREVGVRKVLGAYRRQLGQQFLGESVVLTYIAVATSLVLIHAGKPVLDYIGVPAEISSYAANADLLYLLFGLGLLIGVISGIYPAVGLSRFNPVKVLYGRLFGGKNSEGVVRKGLVILQFSLSIILIVGTLIIYQQMEFISEKNLGFKKEQIVVLTIDDTSIMKQAESFKQELLRHSAIQRIAASNSIPGTGFMSYSVNPEGKQADQSWTVNVLLLGDDDFRETYGIGMVSGRFFSEEYAADDSNAVVINEALVKSLGWEEPVGKHLEIPGELPNGQVIGVLENFHTSSLHKPIEPLILFQDNRWNLLSVRIEPSGIQQTIDYMKQTWNRFEPAYPFDYYFLDERFEAFYTSEKKMLRVAGLFAFLAIAIACLGLFGLATYMVNRRTKEIGIRKVLGSTVFNVVRLLSKDYMMLIGIAFIMAVPVSYILANIWLNEFVYHVEIGLMPFVVAALLTMVPALIAVSYQSIRAATMNPVKSLRSE